MDVIYPRCAGLDVHAETIVACALWEEDGHIQKDIQTFSTFSKGLGDLLEWLEEHGVTRVAMESTGVYWKPVFAFLEGYVDLTLANPQRIKNVPGRKIDVSDAEWIAKLLRHELVEKSFVPPSGYSRIAGFYPPPQKVGRTADFGEKPDSKSARVFQCQNRLGPLRSLRRFWKRHPCPAA